MDRDRGGSFYDDDEVHRAYLSHRHSGLASPNTVMEEPAFLAELGTVRGARILDLGCGDGAFSSYVLARGAASYLGIDGSRSMIETAVQDHGSAAATFELGDLEELATPVSMFDVVTSRMALHYVEDLAPVLAAVHRSLVPGGRLLLSVVHPVITSYADPAPAPGPRTSWTVDDYFVPGPRTRPWFGRDVTWYHRTVEHHLSALRDGGFVLTSLRECEPDATLLAEVPAELQRRRRVPLMLLLGATRSPG